LSKASKCARTPVRLTSLHPLNSPPPPLPPQSLESPGEFLLSDFAKMERPALLHLAFQALDAYQVGTRPRERGCWGLLDP